jgi:uncharacterized protein YlaI
MEITEQVNVEDVNYHTKTIAYYRCGNCLHELDKTCTANPGKKKVSLGKKRNHCKKFTFDEEKFQAAQLRTRPIPIVQRPDWYWLTRIQRRRLRELLGNTVATPAPHTQRDIITPTRSEKLIWTPEDGVDEA